MFSSDLQLNYSFTGDYGRLCGKVSPDMLLYSNNGKLDCYRASNHAYVHTLTQPVSADWGISICRHDSNGWIAITDWKASTLDIYTAEFLHHCRVKLTFHPLEINAICAVRDIIIVATCDSAAELYVYSWDGQELAMIKLEVEGSLGGIGQGGEGQTQICTRYQDNHYLSVFKFE